MTIVDLGCGVGHGSVTLAATPETRVGGVATSVKSFEYGAHHYARPKIEYVRAESA